MVSRGSPKSKLCPMVGSGILYVDHPRDDSLFVFGLQGYRTFEVHHVIQLVWFCFHSNWLRWVLLKPESVTVYDSMMYFLTPFLSCPNPIHFPYFFECVELCRDTNMMFANLYSWNFAGNYSRIVLTFTRHVSHHMSQFYQLSPVSDHWTNITLPETKIAPENGWLEY